VDWIILSFLATINYSAHSLLSKYAFQHHVQSTLAFAFWGESFPAILGLALLLVYPVPYQLFSVPVFLLLAGGTVRVGNVLLRAWAIQREDEITRIVPILDTYPVFVATLSILVLGEKIAPFHWIAIGLVVGGAFLASFEEARSTNQFRRRSTILIALGASLGMGVYSVIGKATLEYVSVWHLIAFSSLFTAPTSALIARLQREWPELVSLPKRPIPLGLAAATATTMLFAVGTGFMAFDRGSVSLSSAIMATRPILLLTIVTLFGLFIPKLRIEYSARGTIRLKATAAVLVTLGVAMIAFR